MNFNFWQNLCKFHLYSSIICGHQPFPRQNQERNGKKKLQMAFKIKIWREGQSIYLGGGREDLLDDGVDAGLDDAALGPAGDPPRGREGGDGVLPALEDARVEEGVELGDEVPLGHRLRHPEEPRRQRRRHEVSRADVDGDAVAELGAQLERLLAAGDVVQRHRHRRRVDAVVIGAEALQEAALEEEGELQGKNT